MATTSFDKVFKVTDQGAIKRLKQAYTHPRIVSVKKRDYKSDEIEGVELLKRKLSDLKAN